MIDITTLLVVSLILLQLYICACTYWVFKKIDRYENVAFSIIDRYLSTRKRNETSVSNWTGGSLSLSNEVSSGCKGALTEGSTTDNAFTIAANDQAINLGIVDARRRIIYYIHKANSFAPERVQTTVNAVMTKWYSQLGLDLLSLGLCMNTKHSDDKTIRDVEAIK